MGQAAWRRAHFRGIVASLGGCRARGLALLSRGRVSRRHFIACGFGLATIAFSGEGSRLCEKGCYSVRCH